MRGTAFLVDPLLTVQESMSDRLYHAHHFMCSVCMQAGRRYGDRCVEGYSLWLAYQAQAKQAGGAALAQAKRDSAATAARLLTPPDGKHGGYFSGVQKHV